MRNVWCTENFTKKVIIANFFSTQKITFGVAPSVFWMTKTYLRRKNMHYCVLYIDKYKLYMH